MKKKFAFTIQEKGQIAKANGLDIWYETFGQKSNPALLLIMGACTQGILWPEEFCERLAAENFYVIRYDHRDTGHSTYFDFTTHPYTILDFTKDAMGLLDALKIQKAHICGLSIGGVIAQLLSIYYPERVTTITLIATSCNFRPMNLSFSGLPAEENSLPPPSEIYLSWMKEFSAHPAKNQEEALAQRMSYWRILNGTVAPFEETYYSELHRVFLSRVKSPEGFKNHIKVCVNSEDIIKETPAQVRVPTLIFHGTEDPIFPPDHGAALAKVIRQSTYFLIDGLGHVLNSQFYECIIKRMKAWQITKEPVLLGSENKKRRVHFF